MKIKSLCMVVLCVILLVLNGIPGGSQSVTGSAETQARVQTLKIVKAQATLKRGETGMIVIQGTPGVQYTLKTTYQKGDRIIPVTQWRTVDEKGEATFNWVVDDETEPKTHNVVITGNGEIVETTHTVLP